MSALFPIDCCGFYCACTAKCVGISLIQSGKQCFRNAAHIVGTKDMMDFGQYCSKTSVVWRLYMGGGGVPTVNTN